MLLFARLMSVHIFAYLSPGTICFSNILFSNFSLQSSLKTFFSFAYFLNQVNAKPGLLSTQMADCGLNPDLWVVTAGPRQHLKGVLYIQKFLSQNVALLVFWPSRVILKHNSSPTALSDCRSGCWSATLQRTPELGLLCLSGSK